MRTDGSYMRIALDFSFRHVTNVRIPVILVSFHFSTHECSPIESCPWRLRDGCSTWTRGMCTYPTLLRWMRNTDPECGCTSFLRMTTPPLLSFQYAFYMTLDSITQRNSFHLQSAWSVSSVLSFGKGACTPTENHSHGKQLESFLSTKKRQMLS